MKNNIFKLELSPTTKLLYLFMQNKSNNGLKSVYFSREEYAESIRISPCSVTAGVRQLEKLGLIKKVKNKFPFDRTLHYEILKEDL